MKRIRFFWILAGVLYGLTGFSDPPNFLFIISDDQSPRAIGSSGNMVIQTPNLDRLASNGMTFTRGFNMGSYAGAICVASRAMLNTGRHVWQAEAAVGSDPLWSEYFEAAGYDTFISGKWHVAGGGLDETSSAAQAFMHAEALAKGFYESTNNYNRPAANPTWSPSNTNLLGHWSPEVWNITNHVISAPYTVEKHTSELYADEAVSYLTNLTAQSDPFFMYVSFNAPHDPRQAPAAYQDMYEPFNPTIPPNLWGEYPFPLKAQRDDKATSYPITESVYMLHLKEYYAMISHMDTQIGRILTALEASGKADNTYVIFTSDHGLAIGEHGYIGKQILHESCARVPFLMKGPGISPGSQEDAMFYLQSIVPTTLELAGITVPSVIDFPSLTGLMNGTTNKLYDSIYGGLFVTGDMPQRMIRTEKYKLIMYPYLEEYLLYDIEKDPWETTNLLAQSTYGQIANDLYAKYQVWHDELADPHVMPFIDFSTVHVDDSDTARIVYSGSWSHISRSVSIEETISLTAQSNDWAELTFDGIDVRLYTQLGAGAGIFDIYLDDVLVDTYDCYAPTQVDKVLAYEAKDLSAGVSHTIRIVNTGTHNPAGNGGINVHLDMITYNRTGMRPAGLADRTDEPGATVTSEHIDSPPGEGHDELFDNDVTTSFVTSNSSGWVQHQFANSDRYAVRWYSVSSSEADPLPPPVELVSNGSFENGITSWSGGTVVTPPVTNDGFSALRMISSSVQTRQTVSSLQVGVDYELSVWIDASGWSSGRAVFDTNDEYDNTCQFVMQSDNGGWTRYTGIFTAMDTDVQLRIFTPANSYQMTGTVYFDNISLSKVQSPPGTSDKDPAGWILSGSNDGNSWDVIDSRSNVVFTEREQVLEFSTELMFNIGYDPYTIWNNGGGGSGYEYYRLDAANKSGSELVYSEIELFGYASEGGQTQWPPVGAPLGDDDADGRENLLEYALDGNPSDAQNVGVDPTFINTGSLFQYTHVQRNNDPSLIYTVESCTNLMEGSWVDSAASKTTNYLGGVFDGVTHDIPMDNPQSYLRLKIVKP